MANIKLGAIITDIAGSVSGSTFRRTPAGTILYNKQGTQIKSAFAQASVKNEISNIFRGWNVLALAEREQWAVNALLYPVKNKFGENKFLTGRQLYTKLNTQLLPTGSMSAVNDFQTFVENREVNLVEFNRSSNKVILEWSGVGNKQWLLVSIYQVRPKGNAKPHTHFKRIFVDYLQEIGQINIWKQFEQTYPFNEEGQWFGFNIQWLNESGIVTSVQSFTAELE